MIHAVYQLLARRGYDRPIHPPATHITIGLTVGTLVFGLVSVTFQRPRLKARQWIPTIIIKMFLPGALFVVLFVALFLGSGREGEVAATSGAVWRSPRSIVVSAVCFGLVTALGYFGATLVY